MIRTRRNRRQGITIVELIVSIIIVVFLICLMLPAIQASRRASWRVTCLNNLRQISLATQNYEQTYTVLPPGVINPTGPVRNAPEDRHLGWIVQLLPFMEQSGLNRSIDPTVSVYDSVNRSVAGTRLTSLMCPSDKLAGSLAGIGVSSYAGCHHDVEAPIDRDNHGVFFLNSRIKITDIEDGTSHTIFVGEKIIEPGDLGWMSGTRATLRNTGSSLNDPTSAVDAASDFFVGGFGSRHPGGAHFIFGDGSVRFLKQTINRDVYRYLGNRNDGEMIDMKYR